MATRFVQHWLAQGVRTFYQLNGFTFIQALNDCAVIFDKGRRIAFAQIGQHAKQVVWTDCNGHDPLIAANVIQPKF